MSCGLFVRFLCTEVALYGRFIFALSLIACEEDSEFLIIVLTFTHNSTFFERLSFLIPYDISNKALKKAIRTPRYDPSDKHQLNPSL